MLTVYIILLCSFAYGNEPELPLCPANIQYLPQNLPMHCRMPVKVEQKNQPFQLPPGFQIMQGMPGLPGVQMSAALPGPPAGAQPIMAGLPPQPMQPMQVLAGMPPPMMPQKLPVVVMPYYSPVQKGTQAKQNHNKARHMYVSDETSDVDSNGSLSEEDSRLYNARRHHRDKRRKLKIKKQMLTPLLQYVTKDGYVIYEKKISNGEAKKWLSTDEDNDDHNKEKDSQERLKESKKIIRNAINKQRILQARKMAKNTGKN